MNVINTTYYANGEVSFTVLYRSYYFKIRTAEVKDVSIFEFSEWGVSCLGNSVKLDDFPNLETAMDFIIDNSYDEWDDDYYDYDCISAYLIDVNSPSEWKDFY